MAFDEESHSQEIKKESQQQEVRLEYQRKEDSSDTSMMLSSLRDGKEI